MYETMSEAIEAYDDLLDNTNEEAFVWGYTYSPSRVLRELDPIAYRCVFADWADAEGIDTDELEDDADLP